MEDTVMPAEAIEPWTLADRLESAIYAIRHARDGNVVSSNGSRFTGSPDCLKSMLNQAEHAVRDALRILNPNQESHHERPQR